MEFKLVLFFILQITCIYFFIKGIKFIIKIIKEENKSKFRKVIIHIIGLCILVYYFIKHIVDLK